MTDEGPNTSKAEVVCESDNLSYEEAARNTNKYGRDTRNRWYYTREGAISTLLGVGGVLPLSPPLENR